MATSATPESPAEVCRRPLPLHIVLHTLEAQPVRRRRPMLRCAVSMRSGIRLLSTRARSPLWEEYVQLMGGHKTVFPATAAPPSLTKDDVLLVVDCQQDFFPVDRETNAFGGAFGVAEADHILPHVVQLIGSAARAGATIVATRDYHPHDHVSFSGQGGPFPPHCVQGSEGAKFMKPVATALADAYRRLGPERVCVAFKGFHERVDSLGALPYDGRDRQDGSEEKQGSQEASGPRAEPQLAAGRMCGCESAPWTGSLLLKQSSLLHTGSHDGLDIDVEIDVNAPPDVLATLSDGVSRGLMSLKERLQAGKVKRLFVCG